MKQQFTLEYWLDDQWYVGRLREIPGVFSQGRSLEELEQNIREVYDLLLDDQPTPSGYDVHRKRIAVEA